MKENCWELKKCGREQNGVKVNELGVCPAAIKIKINGLNSGENGGRCCWAVAGTYCDGKVQGTYAIKALDCMFCEFFQIVLREEVKTCSYTKIPDILKKL